METATHYSDVTMSTGVSIVCSNVCAGADQRKHWPEIRATGLCEALTKGQWGGKCFHLMASSCYIVFNTVHVTCAVSDTVYYIIYFSNENTQGYFPCSVTCVISCIGDGKATGWASWCLWESSVLKIRKICHARDLRKWAWSHQLLRLLYLPDPCNLPGTA